MKYLMTYEDIDWQEDWYEEEDSSGFVLSDRVIHDYFGKGTIVDLHKGKIGIEFDKYVGGHWCNGKGKKGHCFYFPLSHYHHIQKI